ncbi:MAG: ABC transporter ATP-binding protein [Acidimicrobiales bacterium]|jgi:ABC-2 type transport system ATP-binding protein/lipopolysaccharide transport system ATP-binding protein|nr:ABC transporter ATP-binding protein [Acidimicrobiales bacterium]
MAEAPAIAVDDVTKHFRLYKERAGSVKELFTKRRGKRFEEFWALKGVSLEVPHGSMYGLVGHNGSGKSTLLKMMAGILQPTSGRITTDGRISALLELGAGFHPELSGRENIYLNAAILGLHRREVDAIFDDIVDFSGLAGFVDSPVKHYSSGMFVRLGFSVAVHVNPRILIIDEVIAVGDEEFQRRCFDHLYKLRSDGVTIVMVTHSLPLVQAMCDHAAWLDHGNLMAMGTGAEVVHQYLDQVNEAEADRFAEDERVRLAEEAAELAKHRPPSSPAERPVIIERAELLDAAGRPVSLVTPLQPLTVRTHYTCRAPVERPLFSFSIHNEHGVYVANPGMRRAEPGMLEVGPGHVDYRIDRFPLGEGEYHFSFAVHDASATTSLDKRDELATLRVRNGDEYVAGVVDIAGEWAPAGADGSPSGGSR